MPPTKVEVGGVGPVLPFDIALIGEPVARRAELLLEHGLHFAVHFCQFRICLHHLRHETGLQEVDRRVQELTRVVANGRREVVSISGHRRTRCQVNDGIIVAPASGIQVAA